jgi:hypothetical protein
LVVNDAGMSVTTAGSTSVHVHVREAAASDSAKGTRAWNANVTTTAGPSASTNMRVHWLYVLEKVCSDDVVRNVRCCAGHGVDGGMDG